MHVPCIQTIWPSQLSAILRLIGVNLVETANLVSIMAEEREKNVVDQDLAVKKKSSFTNGIILNSGETVCYKHRYCVKHAEQMWLPEEKQQTSLHHHLQYNHKELHKQFKTVKPPIMKHQKVVRTVQLTCSLRYLFMSSHIIMAHCRFSSIHAGLLCVCHIAIYTNIGKIFIFIPRIFSCIIQLYLTDKINKRCRQISQNCSMVRGHGWRDQPTQSPFALQVQILSSVH